MSQVTHLASGAITPSGDTFAVELVEPTDHPAAIRIVWPAKQRSCRPPSSML
jgi:hypothetical protein